MKNTFILTIKVLVFCLPFRLLAQTPVAASLENNIELFTGDFRYNIPLMGISGPNGESFPLQLNYNADIKTNQDASWVGLGWHLSLGEIRRELSGMPDDWDAGAYFEYEMNPSGVESIAKDYRANGPIWFKNYDYNINNEGVLSMMDIAYSRRKADDNELGFEFPDYDGFYVSGPGIGGKMRPYLFDYANLHQYNEGGVVYGNPNDVDNFKKFDKEVQFRFVQDAATARNYWPYYEANDFYEELSNLKRAGPNHLWVNNLHAWDDGIKTPGQVEANFSPSSSMEDYINPNISSNKWDARQTVHAANYIEYFTNQEIADHYSGADLLPNSFVDYVDVDNANNFRNNSSYYDVDGIGAFRITTPSGMIYHYSLPIYIDGQEHISCAFENVNTTPSLKYDEYKKYRKDLKFAYTWKLTAITGPNYEDVNGNNFADEGDKGYWIYINYEKWNQQNRYFKEQSPHSGFFIDKTYKDLPTSVYEDVTYQLSGSKSISNKEMYYPNYIKTQTQTLFIAKEIREDAHDAGSTPMPKMNLKELILIDNKDVTANNIFSTYSSIPTNSNGFSGLGNIVNASNMLHATDYTNNQSSIDPYILGRVSFLYDYSLSPKAYNNINNSLSSSSNYFIGGTEVFQNNLVVSGNAGKLTLNEIQVFGDGGENLYGGSTIPAKPAYQFSYSSLNPDYDHNNRDFFGNYKLHQDLNYFDKVGYCTDDNKNDLDAWALEKIVTPLGGELEVEYEADNYSEIHYQNTRLDIPADPRRFFNFTCQGSDCSDIVFEDPNAIEFLKAIENVQTELRIKYNCPATGTNHTTKHELNPNNYGAISGMYNLALPNPVNFSICSNEDLDGAKGQMMIRLTKVYGGGTRVKSISLYEPDKMEKYKLNIDYGVGVIGTENGRWENTFNLDAKPDLFQSDRFAPSNVVGYKNVKLRLVSVNDGYSNNFGEDFGETEYQFCHRPDLFSRSTFTGHRFIDRSLTSSPNKWHIKNFQKISNYNMGLYGRVKKKILKDKQGAAFQTYEYNYGPSIVDLINIELGSSSTRKIKEIFYKTYSNTLSINGSSAEGLTEQVFAYEEWGHELQSMRMYGQENRTVEFKNFDRWNGAARKINETRPVNFSVDKEYVYEHYSNMGSKFLSASNTNQIAVEYSTTNSRHTEQNNYATWANNYYVRELDGAGNYTYINKTPNYWQARSGFANRLDASGTQVWERINKTTLFNEDYEVLEGIDRRGRFSASKYDVSNRRVIATAAYCNYNSFVASSFEETVTKGGATYFDNELNKGNQHFLETGAIQAHTGEYMAKVPPSTYGPRFFTKVDNLTYDGETLERGILTGRKYEASVWVHQNSTNNAYLKVDVKGANGTYSDLISVKKTDANNLQVGSWILMKTQFEIPSSFTTPGTTDYVKVYLQNSDDEENAYFDDFRVQPVDAQVGAIVYDKRRGLPLYQLDNENFYTRFEYNAAGQVTRVFIETEQGEILTTETETHYAN